MEFRKYTSIENSYNQEFLQSIIEEGLENEIFIVQEKAHGGNLSIWTNNGKDFKTAKRTAFLEPSDKFFNHQSVLETLTPKLIEVWNILNVRYDIQHMTFFGEIIGGVYPHPEIKNINSSIKVQKGVYYSPNNIFYAFDILLNNNLFLSIEESNELFSSIGFLYAKTLFKGSLKEVLNYPNTFQSTISKDLGLPPIEGNTCEGIVIKSLNNLNFENGKRVILKNKNEKWAEREKNKKRKKKPIIGDKIKILIQEIEGYVTENRLNNVISKVGEISQKDFGKIMGMFSKDVIEDFQKDYKNDISNLKDKELKLVTKSITPKMAKLLKVYLHESHNTI